MAEGANQAKSRHVLEPAPRNPKKHGAIMIEKKLLMPSRVRAISGSFAWIPHRFLRDGFWTTLTHHEILLYFFLVQAADRAGLSYYGYDKIMAILNISVEEYILARDGLIDKDLIAFDGFFFQVLSLPQTAKILAGHTPRSLDAMVNSDPVGMSQIAGKLLDGERRC